MPLTVSFSVTGRPCRFGPRLNSDVRYWFCEVEEATTRGKGVGSGGGGEAGWDYCCRPGSRCGYSQGYDYPW